METKKCKACLEEKELCEFRLSAYNDDRYSSKCKLCYKNKLNLECSYIICIFVR